MSSYRSAFLFPRPGKLLKPDNGTKQLCDYTSFIERTIEMCEVSEEDDLMYSTEKGVTIPAPITDAIEGLLNRNQSFVISCKKEHFPYEVEFHFEGRLPKISFHWDQKVMSYCPPAFQADFWIHIEQFAVDCDAGYVVVGDEALYSLEGRIKSTSQGLLFNMEEELPYVDRVYDVWTRNTGDCPPPQGLNYVRSVPMAPSGTFTQHVVELTSSRFDSAR